jgi:hypothetical protein
LVTTWTSTGTLALATAGPSEASAISDASAAIETVILI